MKCAHGMILCKPHPGHTTKPLHGTTCAWRDLCIPTADSSCPNEGCTMCDRTWGSTSGTCSPALPRPWLLQQASAYPSVSFLRSLLAPCFLGSVLNKIRSGASTLPALDQIIAYASSGTIPTYLFPVGATARNRKAPWCRHAPSAIAYAANDLSCSVAIHAPRLEPTFTLAVVAKNSMPSINGHRYPGYRRNHQTVSLSILLD